MRAIDFNTGWTCRHLEDQGQGVPVLIPHDAMLYEKRDESFPGGINTGWYDGRDYCYEKRFDPDPAWEGQHLELEFEGVYHNAEVLLNGKTLAQRPYGYTNFYVDLTDQWIPGAENVLQVIARNSDQPNSRWYSGAGIYRPVTLWAGEKTGYILQNGVRIRTVSLDPPTAEVTVRTSAPGYLSVRILDGDTEIAAENAYTDGQQAVTLPLPGARLWSPDAPCLYTCRVQFENDALSDTFGLRMTRWDKDGFSINGSRVIIQGACIHHDNGVLGARCFEDAEQRKIRLLKENGYNAIRSAHNPCSKALLRACDEQGVLVMDEYIDHWYIHKTQFDYVDYFPRWWKQDLTDMVEKDFNHPSVVLYSIGNEVSETAQEKGIALTAEMVSFLHGLDDSRPVTCGVNIFFNFLSSIGMGVYSDEKAKKELEAAEKKKAAGEKQKKKRAVGSQFFNDVAGILGADFMKNGARLHMCDMKTRDAFAAMDVAGYNYGILRYQKDLKRYPQRLILGSETFCKDAYQFRELAKENPRLVGDFVWAGMDYMGEVGVGSWEYADYAPKEHTVGWVTAGSGRLDLNGRPLGEALYTRVALEKDQGPYLAVCPVDHTGDSHSPSAWKMSNAWPYWGWEGCEGKKAQVEVYARASEAELFLNGVSQGRKPFSKDCILKFTVPYAPGTLKVIAYDANGSPTGECSLSSAGKETRLSLCPEQETVQPGRLCYVWLRYTDEKGIQKPLARGMISVQVSGGTLLGLGSACPYNETGFVSDRTDTYYGEALAVVLAGEGDEILIQATDGTLSGEARVRVE